MLFECKFCQTKQFVLQFIAYDICVTLHTAVERQKSSSALCMPAYIKTNRFSSIAMHCNMCVSIYEHWYGCLYEILCSHMKMLVIKRLSEWTGSCSFVSSCEVFTAMLLMIQVLYGVMLCC